MSSRPTCDTEQNRTYTYPEYKKRFHRGKKKDDKPIEDEREPREIGKEMAKAIIKELMAPK